ncbi:molecular chaperone [Clostridium sp. DJ247]|uniref:TorD/DmsD family molecular chaperone n=1 Tax=Clostridium sp. DJ247 TaxID=2726188 RepID=UPI0016234C34|nr:molecular chaperone TorD family protein [Clostridium sp. DJ247]MBC2582494.1 dehydrogenase [Clostridium sp. DJ247]
MDTIKQWLTERQTIYSILALFYRGDLSKGLDILKSTGILQRFSEYVDNPQLSEGAKIVTKEIDENVKNNKHIDLLLDEHQRLFVGPDHIPAPIYESVYRTKDKLLFGQSELEVRKIYYNSGLEVKSTEPADHLALELSFMARLCFITKDDFSQQVIEYLNKQHDFLKDHLLQWVPLWADAVNANAQTKFWSGLALVTKGWLMNDLAEVQEILTSMFNIEQK